MAITQEQAIAMASARKRRAEQEAAQEQPQQETNGNQRFREALGVAEIGRTAREQTGAAALENLATVGSAIAAEPISGVAGIGTSLVAGPEAGAEAVEAVQEALTLDPITEQGRTNLVNLSKSLQPVAEILERAEQVSGDTGFDIAGPVGGAIGASLPTAALEALGLTGLVGARRVARNAKETARRIDDLAFRSEIDIVDDAGVVTNEAIDFVENAIKRQELSGADDVVGGLQELGILTPEELKRAQVFQRRGVQPLRANLTQSTDDFRDLQDAIKRSGPVAEAVAEQDLSLARVVTEGIENIAPASGDIVQTNSNLFQAVDNVVSSLDRVVDQAYAAARRGAPTARNVRYDNLAGALRKNVGLENASGGIPSALRGELRNKGILTPKSKFDPVGLTDVKTAEEVRQFLNSMFDQQNPRGNSLIRELKDALDEDVAAAAGGDVFAGARKAKQEVQRIIERGQRNRRDKTKGSFLEDVIFNKISEEKIFSRLMSGRDDDFIKFKRFLLQDAGEQGFQTWQDIKGQALRNALEKATKTQGKVEGGGAVFNSRLFANEFKSLKESKKYNELFNLDERELIDDIIEIGTLRIPPRAVQSGSGPSGFAVDAARREIIKRIPLVGPEADALMDTMKNLKTDARQLDPLKETTTAIRGKKPSGS